MHIPQALKIVGHAEPGHLPFRPDREDRNRLAVAQQIGKDWRLVARTLGDDALLPVAGLILRILVPEAFGIGQADHDRIDPAIPIDVLREINEAIAVSFGPIVFPYGPNLVHHPIGRRIPNVAGQNIQLPIPIHISNRHPLAPKRLIHNDLLKTHLTRRSRQGKYHRQNDQQTSPFQFHNNLQFQFRLDHFP